MIEIIEENDEEDKDNEKPFNHKAKVSKLNKISEEFIQRNLQILKKNPNIPIITDMQTWKKRNKVSEKTKVFIIMGGYGDIRRSLKERGWVENKEKDNPCFDLKLTLKAKDIDYKNLVENQIVNHYDKNTLITTKVGLAHNLRNLIWFNNVDIDTFFPRCFDLVDECDHEDFLEEFKSSKVS